jgi:hypothetical protein
MLGDVSPEDFGVPVNVLHPNKRDTPFVNTVNISLCHFRQDDDTETLHRKDYSQDLAPVCKDVFSIHT